jgi:hypothetical protein
MLDGGDLLGQELCDFHTQASGNTQAELPIGTLRAPSSTVATQLGIGMAQARGAGADASVSLSCVWIVRRIRILLPEDCGMPLYNVV